MSKHSGFELVGDIIPDADNTRDLGSSAKRFAEIYIVDGYIETFKGDTYIFESATGWYPLVILKNTNSSSWCQGQIRWIRNDGAGEERLYTIRSYANDVYNILEFYDERAAEIVARLRSSYIDFYRPLHTDTISEHTSDAGVTVDGVLLKDGCVDGVDVSAHASRHEHGGADEINVNDLEGLLAGPQKFKAEDTSSGSTYICRNLKASDGAVADCYGDTVTIKAAEGLRNFIVPLYGMTPQFTEEGRNVYDPYRAAFQFRPPFDCKWAGLRLPLRYVGSPPQLNFNLYRWDGSSWVLVDSMTITTSDCGSNASAGYATFVVKLIDLASREKLNADDLYEVRIASSGSSSNYWRLYYDSVSYRDWKGRDCIGLKLSNDSGANWTDYEGDELSVQVLVSPDV